MVNNYIYFKSKLENIKLLVMDVDGTLTDGGVFYSAEGLELKKFYVHDGMGIRLLHQNNISTAIISSDTSEIPLARARKLNITYQIIGVERKIDSLIEIMNKMNITKDEIAFIGDDVNDLEIIKFAGFTAVPNDAHFSLKQYVDCVLDYNGGHGAVRQICDMILLAKDIKIEVKYNNNIINFNNW